MTFLLVLLALILAAIGAMTLTQATMGVGFVAGACLLAIFARMHQAADHRRSLRLKTRLDRVEELLQAQLIQTAHTVATNSDKGEQKP